MSLLPKVAVSILACAALAGPAAAQQPAAPAQPTAAEPDVGDVTTGSHIIVYGAMKDPSDRATPVTEDHSAPMLPVVYEDAKPNQAAVAPPASPARR